MSADGLKMTAVMAWRNLWRNRRRTLITVTAMVVGLALCIPMYGMIDWMTQEMTRGITRLHMGNIQVHDPKYPKECSILNAFPNSVAKKVASVPGVQAVSPRVYSGGMVSADHRIAVQIHMSSAPIPAGRRLLTGKGLSNQKGPCTALVTKALASTWHIAPGSSLRIDPLPENGACERVVVCGLVADGKDRKAELFVSQNTMTSIAATGTSDSRTGGGTGAGDEADEDIDSLPKLPTKGEDTKPTVPQNKSRTTDRGTKSGTPPLQPGSGKQARTPPNRLAWHVVRSASQPVGIMAVIPNRERRVTAIARHIVAGRYLPDDVGQGPLPILIGKNLAQKLLVKPGDRVGMDVMTPDGFPIDAMFVVAGIFETGVTEMDRSLVEAPMELAWRKDLMNLRNPKTGTLLVNELAIRTVEGANETAVARRIKKVAPGLLVRTWRQVDPNTAQLLKFQNAATAVFLAIIFVIAALGTTNTMLMSVHERTKEFGVLKSVGMGPGRVAGLILSEAVVMTVLATVLGGALGFALDAWMNQYGLDLRSVNPEGLKYQGLVISPIWKAAVNVKVVAVPAGLLALVSLMVAIWPAVRAARIRPVEALRNET